MDIIFFITLTAVAISALVFGVRSKHWSLCGIATIASIIMATQGYQLEVTTGKVVLAIRETTIVLGSWVLTMISLIFTLIGFMSYLSARKSAQPQGTIPGGIS